MAVSTFLFVGGLVLFALPPVRQLSEPVLMAATIVLLATPVTRTLVGAVAFAANGERRSAAVAGIVFLILMLSVVMGFVFHLSR
ncbi:MAG TPA: DUF1634 domain-containing protein [Conexivisphaerales archaeon]|nr:DUF1634 domain-containing protein [Conexivisphaerales archaeon]